MDFKNISSCYAPVYTWCWNAPITKEGIKQRIEEMKSLGIEAFYVIADPDNFRPNDRRTALSPKYMSKEYLELLSYAYELARKENMHTWLYNEGGFPSGMVCGEICRNDITLGRKTISENTVSLKPFEKYVPSKNLISAFDGKTRVREGYTKSKSFTVTEYIALNLEDGKDNPLNTDIADKRTTDMFLELTHERIKKAMPSFIGNDVVYMFDDESQPGNYTNGLQETFREKYGYDMGDYISCIANQKKPRTRKEKQAKMDYERLLGTLTEKNYFRRMKKWLNDNNMKSVGHLDLDHITTGYRLKHYGNPLSTLRAFDVPGIDVIWGQIVIPKDSDKSCPEGTEFFPRFASSASRQIGTRDTLSETFAVYGSHITKNFMRYVVGFQAVRGINIFNFMNMSYGKEGALPLQYRPGFIPDFVGMDTLKPLNEYVKRLSYVLRNGDAYVKTALYFPSDTINSGGKEADKAIASFEKIGEMLDSLNIPFDIIDDDFVLDAKRDGSALYNDHVRYDYIFAPYGKFEPCKVKKILKSRKEKLEPIISSDVKNVMSRRVDTDDAHYYFVFNENNKKVSVRVKFYENAPCYKLDLMSGDIFKVNTIVNCGECEISDTLESGEGTVYFFTKETVEAKEKKDIEKIHEISLFDSYVSRKFEILKNGAHNTYYEPHQFKCDSSIWTDSFSGEVAYEAVYDCDTGEKDVYINLVGVNESAKVFVDGEIRAILSMPPYLCNIGKMRKGSEIKISVSNNIANACVNTDFFETSHPADVGRYHPKMIVFEKEAETNGSFEKAIFFVEK